MEEKIFEYINGVAKKHGRDINPEMDLFAAGVLDSLEIISLLNFLQVEFNVNFSPEDLQFDNYQTLEKIIRWAKGRIG